MLQVHLWNGVDVWSCLQLTLQHKHILAVPWNAKTSCSALHPHQPLWYLWAGRLIDQGLKLWGFAQYTTGSSKYIYLVFCLSLFVQFTCWSCRFIEYQASLILACVESFYLSSTRGPEIAFGLSGIRKVKINQGYVPGDSVVFSP